MHKDHDFFVLEDCYTEKPDIEKYTVEIKQVFSPTYEEIKNEIENNISILDEKYEKLTETDSKQGQKWNKEIESCVLNTKKEINENKVKHQLLLENI